MNRCLLKLHFFNFVHRIVVVLSLAELDHLVTLSDTPGWTTACRATAFIAYPIHRTIVATFRDEVISLVPQTEPATTILDEIQFLLVPNTSVYSGHY